MMKKLLLFVTIILLAVTIFWMIAFYQHIQAYNRMIEESEVDIEHLGNMLDLRKPFWVWGNGPILTVIGLVLAFAWVFLVNEWWMVLKQKEEHGDSFSARVSVNLFASSGVAFSNFV